MHASTDPTVTPHQGLWRPLLHFSLDLLMAAVLLLGLSLAGGVVWALYKLALLLQQGETLPDPSLLASRLGTPGMLVQAAIAVVATAATAAVLYFWRRRADASEREASWRAAKRPQTWGWAVVGGIATFLFATALTALGQHTGTAPAPSNLPVIDAVGGQHPWALLVLAVVLAPAYEELLFRRVLFGRLWVAQRPWLGLLLSSAAFALVHEFPGASANEWPAMVLLWMAYGAMGAVFAAVYWRTRTLWAPIGAHAVNNLIASGLLLAGLG